MIEFCYHFSMPYTYRRSCPLCGKQDLLKLSEHLRQVHNLSNEDRQPFLKNAMFSTGLNNMTQNHCLETKPYPSFRFQHPATMMIVGPTQSGKSIFVEKLLQSALIKYPNRKAIRIHVFYTQWQPLYDRLKDSHGNRIAFTQGLPELDDNLESIDSKVNNVWIIDDLMDEAIQSPVISQLFTRGRHRNLTSILLLQNMFPKGKFNTNISRNALYKVLFRSPGDRKQIDITAEQTFAKDRANFMKAYTKETEKPFGYIVLDNHPRTTNEKQVVANVFEDCYTYPYMTKLPPPTVEQPIQSPTPLPVVKQVIPVIKPVKRKAESLVTAAKKSKRKTDQQIFTGQKQKQPKPSKKKSVKKQKKQVKGSKKPVKKPVKKQAKRLKQPKERFTGGFQDMYEEISSDENFPVEDQSSEHERNSDIENRHCTLEELRQIAMPSYEGGSRDYGQRIH